MMFGKNKGWRTKTAAILTGLYGLVGMGLYVFGGPEAAGALSPAVGIPLCLGAFGLDGAREAIAKVLDGLDGQKE